MKAKLKKLQKTEDTMPFLSQLLREVFSVLPQNYKHWPFLLWSTTFALHVSNISYEEHETLEFLSLFL